MLNGIEVLNESYLINGSEFANGEGLMKILLLSLVIIAIGCLVACFNHVIAHIIGMIIIIFGVGLLFYDLVYSKQPSDIKQYQVTISDNVSVVEFNERYDVISVQGKIYTIVEKEK